ncbi:hypothetical protein C809_01857 [Lachnospiraceae bacterium MD335]|nr:hypothetical protein C809_01857 [Lachnospiraceae bacterium MD335]
MDKAAFNVEGDFYDWCDALDEQWKDTGFCMAIFDAEDDDNNLIFEGSRFQYTPLLPISIPTRLHTRVAEKSAAPF